MARTFATTLTDAKTILRLDATMDSTLTGWLNDVIQDVHSRHDWYWALSRKIVQTVIDKTAGTVSVSSGGATVTGSSTAFDSNDVGSFIQFSGTDDWYRVTAVSATDSLTIDAGYVDTSDLSAGTYILRKIYYSISGAEKILSATQSILPSNLVCLTYKDFERNLPFSDDTGDASSYCLYGVDSSNNLQFEIHPHADVKYNIEVKYKTKATEDSIEATPEKWRGVYLAGLLAKGYEYVAFGQPDFDKSMVRHKVSEYENMIARMKSAAEPTSDYSPRLQNRDVPLVPSFPHLPDGLSIPID